MARTIRAGRVRARRVRIADGIVIVVVNRADIDAVIDGYNFITLLREKYERVRLDLMPDAE